jgi:hypothetical protein
MVGDVGWLDAAHQLAQGLQESRIERVDRADRQRDGFR